MSTLSARFTQGPQEAKRYMLDYTLFLSTGEAVTSVVATITNMGTPPQGSPPLVVSSTVIGPGGLQVIFFVSGGVSGQSYEISFIATTSIGQKLQDIVQYDIVEKT